MSGMSLEKHFSLSSSSLVKEICDPLLQSIGITYFNYIKIYNNDCSRELLTNNADWINHFYKNTNITIQDCLLNMHLTLF